MLSKREKKIMSIIATDVLAKIYLSKNSDDAISDIIKYVKSLDCFDLQTLTSYSGDLRKEIFVEEV